MQPMWVWCEGDHPSYIGRRKKICRSGIINCSAALAVTGVSENGRLSNRRKSFTVMFVERTSSCQLGESKSDGRGPYPDRHGRRRMEPT